MDYSLEEHDNQARARNGSHLFYELLQEMAEIHDKKSHDYADDKNPFANYHFAGQLSLLFNASPNDAGFVGRIGEKLYRLANLESSGKTPLNESIEDTERDLCVIMALWMADRRTRRKINRKSSPEQAFSRIIEAEVLLTNDDRIQLISYLQNVVTSINKKQEV